jgi:hypothetical protein
MRFRKLRIAWSVGWGVAAALLVALWVRSYSQLDEVAWGTATEYYGFVVSCVGEIDISESFRLESGGKRTMQDSRSSFKFIGLEFDWLGIAGFASATRMGNGSVRIPDWALVTFCISLGTAPWIRQQYSLRTLLIATTLVAVVLGLIVWLNHH